MSDPNALPEFDTPRSFAPNLGDGVGGTTCEDAKTLWTLDLTQAKREVLRAYLDCADENGVSSPTVDEVSWMTGYHERHVQRTTRALEADGLLVATLRPGKATEYRFDLSKAALKPPRTTGVTYVTPDIQAAPLSRGDISEGVTPDVRGDISEGVTPDVRGDMPGGDAIVAPLTPTHVPAPAREESLKALRVGSTEIQDQTLKDKDKNAAAAAGGRVRDELLPERPNAFRVYESCFGGISGFIADTIRDWLANYPVDWVEDAIRESALSGGRSPKHIQAILDRWQRDGKNAPRPASVKGAYPPRAAPAVAAAAPVKTPSIPTTSLGAPTLRPGARPGKS